MYDAVGKYAKCKLLLYGSHDRVLARDSVYRPSRVASDIRVFEDGNSFTKQTNY